MTAIPFNVYHIFKRTYGSEQAQMIINYISDNRQCSVSDLKEIFITKEEHKDTISGINKLSDRIDRQGERIDKLGDRIDKMTEAMSNHFRWLLGIIFTLIGLALTVIGLIIAFMKIH